MSKSELFNNKDVTEEYLKIKKDQKYKEWVESLYNNCYQYLPKDFSSFAQICDIKNEEEEIIINIKNN